MSWRPDFERRSRTALRRLTALPRWALAVTVVGVLLLGLMVTGPVGAVALALLAGLLGWLLALSWPAITPVGRAVRLAVVVALIVLAGSRW